MALANHLLTYIFYHLLQERAQTLTVPAGGVKQFRCAFFNFTGGANQTGGWSYRGVETKVINDTHVGCNASHLTSFVVLVSIIPAVGDPVSNWFSIVLELNIDVCQHMQTPCLVTQQFSTSFSAPPLGLHHVHWLQHFFTLLACLHHILLVTKVN